MSKESEQQDLRRLVNLVHNPNDYTVNLPNRAYSIQSEDETRGLILVDLRNDEQRAFYDAFRTWMRENGGINEEH